MLYITYVVLVQLNEQQPTLGSCLEFGRVSIPLLLVVDQLFKFNKRNLFVYYLDLLSLPSFIERPNKKVIRLARLYQQFVFILLWQFLC